MVKAQEWLESQEEYNTKEKRTRVKKLDIVSNDLEGELNLGDFINLENLYCADNQLASLDLSDLPNLNSIYCHNTLLTDIILPKNSTNLRKLYLHDNNFSAEKDLSFLTSFTNLETLFLGNNGESKTKNKFSGSLKYLQNLKKLEILGISNTNINSGLEYLSDSIEEIYCSSEERPESKVVQIREQLALYDGSFSILKEWKKRGFDNKETKQLKEIGLKTNEWDFASYLRKQKEYGSISEFNIENVENLRESFNNW